MCVANRCWKTHHPLHILRSKLKWPSPSQLCAANHPLTPASTPMSSGMSTSDYITFIIHKSALRMPDRSTDCLKLLYLPLFSCGGPAGCRKSMLGPCRSKREFIHALRGNTSDATDCLFLCLLVRDLRSTDARDDGIGSGRDLVLWGAI